MTATDAIPVIFCIDSEPNELDAERKEAAPWAEVEKCFSRLEAYRPLLADATGSDAAFTWTVRADPQLAEIYGDAAWGLRHYAATWRALLARGDEVGLHPHPQRWSDDCLAWVGGQAETSWPATVLREGHAAYCRVLGRNPESMRFGNRFMSQQLAEAADELGVRYDLTLEPGYSGRTGERPEHRLPGFCPDYFEVPRVPYRPGVGAYRSPDPERKTGLGFIPLSTSVLGENLPTARAPYYRAAAPTDQAYEAFLLRIAPALFGPAADHVLRELAVPYLALVIRCDMIEMPEVWANLEFLRTHPLAKRFVFATPDQAWHMLCDRSDPQ